MSHSCLRLREKVCTDRDCTRHPVLHLIHNLEAIRQACPRTLLWKEWVQSRELKIAGEHSPKKPLYKVLEFKPIWESLRKASKEKAWFNQDEGLRDIFGFSYFRCKFDCNMDYISQKAFDSMHLCSEYRHYRTSSLNCQSNTSYCDRCSQ